MKVVCRDLYLKLAFDTHQEISSFQVFFQNILQNFLCHAMYCRGAVITNFRSLPHFLANAKLLSSSLKFSHLLNISATKAFCHFSREIISQPSSSQYQEDASYTLSKSRHKEQKSVRNNHPKTSSINAYAGQLILFSTTSEPNELAAKTSHHSTRSK